MPRTPDGGEPHGNGRKSVKGARRAADDDDVTPDLLSTSPTDDLDDDLLESPRPDDDLVGPRDGAVVGADDPVSAGAVDLASDGADDDPLDPDAVKALLEGQYPTFDRLRDARSRIAQERALAAVRGRDAVSVRRAGGSRRNVAIAVVLGIVALVVGVRVLAPDDAAVEVTATTPAEALPWRSYTSPSGNFRVDLPGMPLVVPVDQEGVALRLTLSIPGAEIAIDVDRAGSGSTAALTAAAEEWAAPKGLRLEDVAPARAPWGNVVDATLTDPSPVGLLRTTSSKTYQFTVTVRSDFVSARTAAIHERIVTSFRAVDPR